MREVQSFKIKEPDEEYLIRLESSDNISYLSFE